MVPVDLVLFTVFTLARGACIHFWIFNQVKLRHVAACDCSFSELAFREPHQSPEVLYELINIFLVIVEYNFCVAVVFSVLG